MQIKITLLFASLLVWAGCTHITNNSWQNVQIHLFISIGLKKIEVQTVLLLGNSPSNLSPGEVEFLITPERVSPYRLPIWMIEANINVYSSFSHLKGGS